MINPNEVFQIGQFAKPHGIRGEITLITDYDLIENLEEQNEPYIICDMEGILVPFFIEAYRYKTNASMLLKLEGVDTESEAREFVGRSVYYPLNKVDAESLTENMSWHNFIGFNVIDKHLGEIGEIIDVDDSTLNVLFQISHEGREILCPATDEFIVNIDYEDKHIFVAMPEGLLHL